MPRTKLSRLDTEAPNPPKPEKVAKKAAVKKTISKIDLVKQQLQQEMKSNFDQLTELLKKNHINGNGHNGNGHHTNGAAPEPAAAPKPKTDFNLGRDEFYQELNNTEKEIPYKAEPIIDNPPPPPPPSTDNEPKNNGQQQKTDTEEEEEEIPEVQWSEDDIDHIIDMIPFLEAAVGNGIFMLMNFIDPTFNRKIDESKIPPIDEFRRKILRPGIQVFASKIVQTWNDPGYIYMVLAAFTILDMFQYSEPVDPMPQE